MAEIFNAKKKKERLSVTQMRKLIGKNGNDGLFTSFSTFPENVCFQTQEEGEEVILFFRQHPIVTVSWIVLTMFMLTLPSVFAFFPPFATLPANYQIVITLGWYMFTIGFALAKFMAWFFNVYIVTDERIVDVDFQNIFFRKISTAKIDEIQDVNITSSGAFETFFGYGNIFIQTASAVSEFEFIAIPRPDEIGKFLNQLIDQEEQEQIEGRVK